jgi:hypothetical protein
MDHDGVPAGRHTCPYDDKASGRIATLRQTFLR